MVEIKTSYEDKESFIAIGKITAKLYLLLTTYRIENIIEYLDLSTLRRLNLEPKRINIEFPTWMVKKLDEEAEHIDG